MRLKVFILAFLILLSPDKARSEGSLDAMTEFCTTALPVVQGIASLTFPQLFPTIQATPLGPMPGLMMGLAQQSSVLAELCDIAMNLSQLEGYEALFYSGQVLNKMTDKKWDHHLTMVDKTHNLANTIYDFEAGEQRKGAFESRSTYQEMNDYMGTSYSWYHKTVNGKDARMKNRREREQDMSQLARVAHKRAILAEVTNCPQGTSDNSDYGKIYDKEVQPWIEKREEAREDYNFYKGQLLDMGPRFMNNEEEMTEYLSDLNKLEISGVSYDIKNKDKQEISRVPSDRIDRNTDKPKWKDKTITRKTQVFTVRLYTEQFQKFRSRWGPQWNSWVKAEYLSRGTRGILNDPRGKVESEFVNLGYECNSYRLMRGVSTDRPDYNKEQDRRIEQCKTDLRTNQKKSEGLLNYYVNNLSSSLYRLKQANSKIWTAESFYLGKNRSITAASNDNFQQEKVVCEESKNLSSAEMRLLKLKQQENLNEYKEIIAKNQMQKTNLMESEKKAQASNVNELRRRRQFSERKVKDGQQDLRDSSMAPVPTEGGM